MKAFSQILNLSLLTLDVRTFPTWKAPCDAVTGGDGVFWRRPVDADRLTMFISVACRLINLVKSE